MRSAQPHDFEVGIWPCVVWVVGVRVRCAANRAGLRQEPALADRVLSPPAHRVLLVLPFGLGGCRLALLAALIGLGGARLTCGAVTATHVIPAAVELVERLELAADAAALETPERLGDGYRWLGFAIRCHRDVNIAAHSDSFLRPLADALNRAVDRAHLADRSSGAAWPPRRRALELGGFALLGLPLSDLELAGERQGVEVQGY